MFAILLDQKSFATFNPILLLNEFIRFATVFKVQPQLIILTGKNAARSS